jgi:hypothetical protein
MQPWVDKASSSSTANTSSLHYDKTLSYLNNKQASSSSSSQQQGFRTASSRSSITPNKRDEIDHDYNNQYSSFASHHFSPLITPPQYENPLDGSDVLSFLNSTEYSDHIHGDDLRPDSMTYISHRHQQDTHQALSEKEKSQQHWTAELLAAEDIVEYLQNADYIEDIYGIPILGQWIREAQQEIKQDDSHKKVAVERLTMIRQHLIQKAMGNPELAARNAFQMTQNDWSSTFLDSSF